MRENFEIFCSHCPSDPKDKSGASCGYFIVNWDMRRTGKFLFVCPNCQREHARTIKEGAMKSNDSEARFIGGVGKIDIEHTGGGHRPDWERVVVMKSAWSRKARLELLKVVPCGFLSDSWIRKAAAEKGAIDHEFEDKE
jgi:hypothetical protein